MTQKDNAPKIKYGLFFADETDAPKNAASPDEPASRGEYKREDSRRRAFARKDDAERAVADELVRAAEEKREAGKDDSYRDEV